MSAALYLIVVIFICFVIRLLFVCIQIRSQNNSKEALKNDEKTAAIISLGSGGHTSEILRLTNALGPKYERTYIVANSDNMSIEKLRKMHNDDQTLYEIVTIPRSRKVHQSYLTSVITTIYSCVYSLAVAIQVLPDLVICNGPGTCIPICLAVFLLRVIGIKYCQIIFVESICRVETISLSGKILYLIADEFIVQWPVLMEKYPRAKYLGRLV